MWGHRDSSASLGDFEVPVGGWPRGPEKEGAGSIPLGEDRACPVSGSRSVTGVDSDCPSGRGVPPNCAVVQRPSHRIPVVNHTRVRNMRRREATFVELDTSQHNMYPGRRGSTYQG